MLSENHIKSVSSVFHLSENHNNPCHQRSILKKAIMLGLLLILLVAYYFCLPSPLFNKPESYTLFDRKGNLHGARIAEDGQWRFPQQVELPEKFEKCITIFEDKRFYSHPGIDVLAAFRAIRQNFKSGKKVSGASTLSMQVMRMAGNRERTVFAKVIESIQATRLELKCSKKEILSLYASNAPFGGNVVGLQAASWRYYGKPAELLSWGEAATLAVLPNSPGLVRPGKNSHVLQRKRDFVLDKLLEEGIIDETTCKLAKIEKLPGKPHPLPDEAPQLLAKLMNEKASLQNRQLTSSIDARLQQRVNETLDRHHRLLSGNGIFNGAVVVIKVKSGEVLAYAGNVKNPLTETHHHVDNAIASRSTGSILKPFIYAAMLDEGMLLPEMLVADVPVYINRYSPKNYNSTYAGAVPADKALARSLNIPAVHMLMDYTPARFTHKLKQMGFTTFTRSPQNYGLSLILGGGEANLLELAGAYASMARALNHFTETGKYPKDAFRKPFLLKPDSPAVVEEEESSVFSASAIYQTFEAMAKVSRPDEEKFWASFASSGKVAWKTGTSFGNRDAWAIGCTPEYVVAVWIGNSNGEGRPGLTGISSAAPVLFDVFNMLPASNEWFTKPLKDIRKEQICKESGHLATEHCPEVKVQWVKNTDFKNALCPYHHLVHLDEKEEYRVHADCEDLSNMVHKPWFVLPPSLEQYFKMNHPSYKELPLLRIDCRGQISGSKANDISLIYPQNPTAIYLPINLDGSQSSAVFEAAHRNLSATLYWHIGSEYFGSTKTMHKKSFKLKPGKHKLVLIDDAGNRLEHEVEVLGEVGRSSSK